CPGARLLRYPVWAWHWLDATAPAAPFAAVRVPLAAGTRARKRCAIACFASQTGGTLRPRRPDPVLPQRVLDRFRRPFEVYLRGAARTTWTGRGRRATPPPATGRAGTRRASGRC